MESNTAWQQTEGFAEAFANLQRFYDVRERYLEDEFLRARIDSGDVSDTLSELGIAETPGVEMRIVVDTPDRVHFVLPPDPNVELGDESLAAVAGGKTAGSAGSVSSASSVGCSTVPSSVSSAGTAGTVGTAS